MNRRSFVKGVTATAGLSVIAGWPSIATATGKDSTMTVQQVIDLIIRSIPGGAIAGTVDTIKAGDANSIVKGIVTTMFATVEMIEQTAKAGANFIIAHEPTFYNHADKTDWLQKDSVYAFKTALLKKHGITVWRCHDYLHAHQPDGVLTGVLEQLGWSSYAEKNKPHIVTIPPATLGSIIDLAKAKLGIAHLRYAGNPATSCRRIAVLPGAAGGADQITVLSTEKPDLLIIGELSEWETLEYVRDLQASGSTTSLLILNHIPSEEPGLEWLANWLRPQVKNIPVQHIATSSATSWS